jgi:hypothetical protein
LSPAGAGVESRTASSLSPRAGRLRGCGERVSDTIETPRSERGSKSKGGRGETCLPRAAGPARPAARTRNARKAGLISAPTFGYEASTLERKGGIRLAAPSH